MQYTCVILIELKCAAFYIPELFENRLQQVLLLQCVFTSLVCYLRAVYFEAVEELFKVRM